MSQPTEAECSCNAGDAPRAAHSRLCPVFRSLTGAEQAKVQDAINDRADEHVCEIGQTFLGDHWDVTCSCGFEVLNLSSREAADDTVLWHHGKPSALGGDL